MHHGIYPRLPDKRSRQYPAYTSATCIPGIFSLEPSLTARTPVDLLTLPRMASREANSPSSTNKVVTSAPTLTTAIASPRSTSLTSCSLSTTSMCPHLHTAAALCCSMIGAIRDTSRLLREAALATTRYFSSPLPLIPRSRRSSRTSAAPAFSAAPST